MEGMLRRRKRREAIRAPEILRKALTSEQFQIRAACASGQRVGLFLDIRPPAHGIA